MSFSDEYLLSIDYVLPFWKNERVLPIIQNLFIHESAIKTVYI